MWRWLLAATVVVGAAAGIYLLRPVSGLAIDTTLVGDAGRGAYLMRLGGCVACHTDAKAGGARLAGGAALATPFGSFVPPNITPDPAAGIGRWTLAQFGDAMRNGDGPQGHLYPAFPYDSYTLMSDQEIADLFAALMAEPAVAQKAPDHQIAFPFNIRLAMAGWKNLFFTPGRFQPDAEKSEVWNRGAYLANGPAHCVACHSPRNLFGAIEGGKRFTGNPSGGPGGRAPALTKAALADEGYDVPTLVQTLKDGFTPGFDVLGGAMGEVITEGTSHWTDADLQALAAYLLDEG